MNMNHCFVKYARELHEICLPLFTATPVTYFSTVRVYKDGSYSGVVSDIGWAKHYLLNKYDECSLEYYQAYIANKPYILWSLSSIFNIDKIAQRLYKDCILFNYTNGITLIEKDCDYVDLYYFVSGAKDKVDEFFIYNIDQLELFVLYFKQIINTDSCLKNIYSSRYYKNDRCVQLHTLSDQSTNLSEYLSIKKYYLGHDYSYLTAKEMRVLSDFINGNSSKQIAREHKCSPRTVETHLANIKIKLNVGKKNDLLKLAHNNVYIKSFMHI